MLEKLLLIIVEAALELVPPECRKHPSVVKDAKRRGKTPGEVLLDRSYHHAAMKELRNSHKRGRPDITHFSLLEALGSPLNRKGMLETYVTTIDNYVIYVKPYVRLPKNYDRFKGLVEQLYRKQVITAEDGRELLSIQRKPLRQLLKELSPSTVLLMSE
ncbi:MAG TPA: 16S rRNA methyltransferase, partial [Aigarchaeota archaeon]|nr:16S rRNA methyltransferase [Aigarchaeota archaeon]